MATAASAAEIKKIPGFSLATDQLKSRDWRINHLYFIKNVDGKETRFNRNAAQKAFAQNTWYRDVICKARKLGFSTDIAIQIIDESIFNSHKVSAIVDYKLPDAIKKLDMIRYAYERLPTTIREVVRLTKDNEAEMHLSNGSKISVGTSYRGDTPQLLHISEYGKISTDNPNAANEIKTGAIQSVGMNGKVFVESTAHGAGGEFYTMVQRAEAVQKSGQELTKLDFKLHFYGWHIDPSYRLQNNLVTITQEVTEYFRLLRANHGLIVDADQIAFYQKKLEELGPDDIKSEFPSIMEECFFNSLEGAYFKREMGRARNDRRIGLPVPYDPTRPVNTFGDIGMDDEQAIWFHQTDGVRHRFIDFSQSSGEGLSHYIRVLKEKAEERGFIYGKHYGPHDLSVREWGNPSVQTRAQTAAGFGIKFIIVPKVQDKGEAIEAARRFIGLSYFDSVHCAEGIKALDNYRKTWNEKLAAWSAIPVHDWACITGDTKVLTRAGKQSIKELPDTGEVLTPCGWKRYVNPRITRKNAPLVEVKFEGGLLVRCTAEHLFLTDSGWKFAISLLKDSLIQSSLSRLPSISTVDYIAFGPVKTISRAVANAFTALCGQLFMVPSLQAATSTIVKQAIPREMASKISNVFHLPSTSQLPGGIGRLQGSSAYSRPAPAIRLLNGIVRKLVAFGIVVTRSDRSLGKSGNGKIASVLFAGLASIAWFGARAIRASIARTNVDTLRIVSVEKLPDLEDVWCLTVPEVNCFSLENGAVIHNSHPADALMCGAMGWVPDNVPSGKPKNKKEGSAWSA